MMGSNELTPVEQALETCVETAPSRDGKTRILFLIDEIEAITDGGTERQILQLIQLAKRLDYEPRLAVLRGSEWLNETQAGCPVYLVNARSLLRPSGWLACLNLVRWMKHERIALVQTFFMESNLIGPALARLAGVPTVIGSRRNLNQWKERPAWTRPALRQLQRFANLPTDCIIGNSHVVADSMIHVEGVAPHKLRVAYNGIELNRFSGLERLRLDARCLLGVADGEILIGNISCLRPVKGVDHFVEAAHIALETDPNLQFVIVGDGVGMPAIRARIARHGIEKQVRLVGAQEDVLPFLAAMDIGVLSSLGEGFSNSLLEYMASGLAVVATDVGGNREALEETGILVPSRNARALADAILKLRNMELRGRLGREARIRVERFSLDRAEQRMEEIYSELLSAKKITLRAN